MLMMIFVISRRRLERELAVAEGIHGDGKVAEAGHTICT